MTVTPLNTHCPFLYWVEDVVEHRVPGDTDYLFEVPAKVGGRGPLDPFGWRGGVGGGGVFVVLLGLGDDRAGGIGRFGEILEWVLGISIVNLQCKKKPNKIECIIIFKMYRSLVSLKNRPGIQ